MHLLVLLFGKTNVVIYETSLFTHRSKRIASMATYYHLLIVHKNEFDSSPECTSTMNKNSPSFRLTTSGLWSEEVYDELKYRAAGVMLPEGTSHSHLARFTQQ